MNLERLFGFIVAVFVVLFVLWFLVNLMHHA